MATSGDFYLAIDNIQTEDINLAARDRMNKKEQDDLDLDAGADAAKLKDR